MNIGVALRGMAVLAANAARKADGVEAAAVAAVNEAAQAVLSESQRRVPVDTGNLRGSGRIDPATRSAPVATVSYGGTAAGYALSVHELHPTKSKYLEAPARELAPKFLDGMTAAARKSLA